MQHRVDGRMLREVLDTLLDVFRMRQYFDAITRLRQVNEGVRHDVAFLAEARRALLPLPIDHRPATRPSPFPPSERLVLPGLDHKRLALLSTGGSGALAALVGVGRALEEAGVKPSVISLCSGSAMFGFPLAAGIPAEKVAAFTAGLRPADYLDPDWKAVASLLPTRGRGFAGLLRGERLEAAYRSLLGDMTLGELPTPAYAPIWSVEENRLEYLGPRTYPDVPVARAVHMAVALPLFLEPTALGSGYWCDGGIVDIFPVVPVLDLEGGCDAALCVNCFYPPGFAGEDASGWQDRTASILHVASQVRTCQQVELARTNLRRLEEAADVVMLEPVSYDVVRGVGFYRQFMNTDDWPAFMKAGRRDARRALHRRFGAAAASETASSVTSTAA